MAHDLEIFYEDMEVGYFLEPASPRQPGRYHYEPYRSLAYYDMQEALHQQGFARCSYSTGQDRVTFSVVACPEYGILELADFEFSAPA